MTREEKQKQRAMATFGAFLFKTKALFREIFIYF